MSEPEPQAVFVADTPTFVDHMFDLMLASIPLSAFSLGVIMMYVGSPSSSSKPEDEDGLFRLGLSICLLALIGLWYMPVRLLVYQGRFYIKILDESIEYQWIEGKKKTILFSEIADYFTSEGILQLQHKEPWSGMGVQLYYMSHANREVLLGMIEQRCGFPPSCRN
jgi:hypothetical protein